jgi:iron complex transport system substrate-binding protein
VAGLDNGCCFTHARNGWGGLVEAAGGENIGSQLLPGHLHGHVAAAFEGDK